MPKSTKCSKLFCWTKTPGKPDIRLNRLSRPTVKQLLEISKTETRKLPKNDSGTPDRSKPRTLSRSHQTIPESQIQRSIGYPSEISRRKQHRSSKSPLRHSLQQSKRVSTMARNFRNIPTLRRKKSCLRSNHRRKSLLSGKTEWAQLRKGFRLVLQSSRKWEFIRPILIRQHVWKRDIRRTKLRYGSLLL